MASAVQSRVEPNCLPPRHRLGWHEQAAAVCYRLGDRGVEFLLVRTRNGRWTFPKGGIEPGLTHAQSAALEAFEEAGVHGRIELAAFARYGRCRSSKSSGKSVVVLAFLCEVHRLGKPRELNRDRTWFPAEKAKRRLQEGRTSEFGAELAVVVDRAVARVKRLRGGFAHREAAQEARKDTLQRVCLELPDAQELQARAAAMANYLRRQSVPQDHGVPQAACEVMPPARQRFLPGEVQKLTRPLLRLGSGSKPLASATAKVTAIDGTRRP